ncbi:MAG TPA: hypothetical protein VJS16_07440 [Gammaproteobacteria bacterium]|nr:hypothetical protein [Gammaproteobacteria bacterium]
MLSQRTHKRFGIRCTLPPDNPMTAPHLLGPAWESYRWFETAEERDAFYADYASEHVYSRRGDLPGVIYTKVER